MTCEAFPSIDALTNYTFTTRISPAQTKTVATIIIDGNQYNITDAVGMTYSMLHLVDAINATAVVSDKIVASVGTTATGDIGLILRAKDATVTNISVTNDMSFVANWAPAAASQHMVGTKSVNSAALVPSSQMRKLEPKPATPSLAEVYIPLHTEIVSDNPVVDIDFWLDAIRHPALSLWAGSIIAAKHIDTNEDIVFVSYTDTGNNFAGIEVRYATGAKKGQLVTTGYGTGRLYFPPYDSTWLSSAPLILSVSTTLDKTNGTIYVKSIISGLIAPDSNDPTTSLDTSAVVITSINPRLNTVNWSKMIAHDNYLAGNPGSYGVYQRSEKGLIVDGNHNVIITSNLVIPVIDSYTGLESVAPGVGISKIDAAGNILWTKIIDSSQGMSVVDSTTISFVSTKNVGWAWHVPATVSLGLDGSIWAAHGSMIHHISTTGVVGESIRFADLATDQYGFSCIGDVQVHPTTGNLFVAISGSSPNGKRCRIVEVPSSTPVGAGGVALKTVWLSPCRTQITNPWGAGSQYIFPPMSLKMDSTNGMLYAMAMLDFHGLDAYSQTPTAGVTVYAINTATATIDWSNDFNITAFDASTNQVFVDGPMPAYGLYNYLSGMSDFDIVPNVAGTNMLCYTSSVALGGSAPGAVAIFATTASQSTNVTSSSASAVAYAITDMSLVDKTTSYTLLQYGHDSQYEYITPNVVNLTTYVRASAPNIAIQADTTYSATFVEYTYVIPPYAATVNTSLSVKNVATFGELQLGGLFPVPSTDAGMPTDKAGAIRADATGLYYCTADYDGVSNIWKSIPFGAGKYGRIKKVAPGVNPSFGTITGCPTDAIGDVYVAGDVVLTCVGTYNGSSAIWQPVLPTIGNGLTITQNINFSSSTTDPVNWPNGAYLTGYDVTLSAPTAVVSASSNTTNYIYSTSSSSGRLVLNASGDATVTMSGYYYAYNTGFTYGLTNVSNSGYVQLVAPIYGSVQSGQSPYIRCGESVTLMVNPMNQAQILIIDRMPGGQVFYGYSTGSGTIYAARYYIHNIVINGNWTVPAPVHPGPIDGETFTLRIVQQGNSFTLGWNSVYRFNNGSAPSAPNAWCMHVVKCTYSSVYQRWLCDVTQNVPLT